MKKDKTAYLMSSKINADRINNALNSDVGSVTYRDLDELKKAIDQLEFDKGKKVSLSDPKKSYYKRKKS